MTELVLSAETFLKRVRSMGSDAEDVRDAAHEAFHALENRVAAPWTRERVHEAMLARYETKPPAELWLHELIARILEQVVCSKLGADAGGDLKHWITVSSFEAVRRGVPYGRPEASYQMALNLAETRHVQRWAIKLLALTFTDKPKTKLDPKKRRTRTRRS